MLFSEVGIQPREVDVANDLVNIFGEQHEICSLNKLGHGNELEMKSKDDECFVTNLEKRKVYSLGWEDIEEATDNDAFLTKLREALISDNRKKLEELLSGRLIHCSSLKNGLSKITIDDLSLYHNCIMVHNRIWGRMLSRRTSSTTSTWATGAWT